MAENLNCFARGIHYDTTVLTMFQVALQFPHQFRIKFAVEIFRDFIDELSASHGGHPFQNTWSIPRATSGESVKAGSLPRECSRRSSWQSPRSRTSQRLGE